MPAPALVLGGNQKQTIMGESISRSILKAEEKLPRTIDTISVPKESQETRRFLVSSVPASTAGKGTADEGQQRDKKTRGTAD